MKKQLFLTMLISLSSYASAMSAEKERAYVLSGHQLMREKKYEHAKAIFESVAQSTNEGPQKIALMALGDMAFVGWAGPVDYEQALWWYAQVLDLSRIAPKSQDDDRDPGFAHDEHADTAQGTVKPDTDCLKKADDCWFDGGTHEAVLDAWQLYAQVAKEADTVQDHYYAQVRLQTMYYSLDRYRVPRWWWQPRNEKGLVTGEWQDDHLVLVERLQGLMDSTISSSKQPHAAMQ